MVEGETEYRASFFGGTGGPSLARFNVTPEARSFPKAQGGERPNTGKRIGRRGRAGPAQPVLLPELQHVLPLLLLQPLQLLHLLQLL